MRVISVETRTHGRALIRDTNAPPRRVVVGFHGYGQSAEDMLSELERIPGSGRWTLLSVQALNRFYSRGQEKVVASWMTRQDRELAIADNLDYVDRVVGSLLAHVHGVPIVFVGFSQGVAMAYRAAVAGAHRVRFVIAIGGDVPPDVLSAPAERFPSILIAAGRSDEWYTPAKLAADETALRRLGARLDIFRYEGGHEWTPELRDRAGQVIEHLA